MARQTFRLNLGSAEFPLLSGLYGASIVLPQQDMHYIRPNAFSGSEADKNIGIPQLLFCENIMPASYGYQSVGFQTVIQSRGINEFDQAFYLRDAAENRTLFVNGANAAVAQRFTYNSTTNAWNNSPIAIPTPNCKCTVANLKSRTFIKWEFEANFYEWTGVWNVVAIPALVAANIKGLVAANNYLIAYDDTTIYWSSTTSVTDFIPSLATGAGSQRILSNKGRITVCRPIEDGFIIHTTDNAIVAKYSNNIRFPWVFREIKNSAGLESAEHAVTEGEGPTIYVWTTKGLMGYNATKADYVHPAVSEFLSCRRLERYNYTTGVIEELDVTDKLPVKVEFIANRWLVISYGLPSDVVPVIHQYALIYDSALKRWGKVAIDHTDVFEFHGNVGPVGTIETLTWAQLPGTWAQQNNTWAEYGAIISGGSATLTVPYRSLGFLTRDGSVKVLNFDMSNTIDNGILYLGEIRFVRDRRIVLQEVFAKRMDSSTQTNMAVIRMKNGSMLPAIYPFRKSLKTEKEQHWMGGNIEAEALILRFEGSFNLNTVIARTTLGGKR